MFSVDGWVKQYLGLVGCLRLTDSGKINSILLVDEMWQNDMYRTVSRH